MFLAVIKDSIISSILLKVSSKVEARSSLVSLFGEEYVQFHVISITKVK